MAWEENSRICLHMQLIAILSRIGVSQYNNLPNEMFVKHHVSQVTYLRFASAMFIYRKCHIYDM